MPYSKRDFHETRTLEHNTLRRKWNPNITYLFTERFVRRSMKWLDARNFLRYSSVSCKPIPYFGTKMIFCHCFFTFLSICVNFGVVAAMEIYHYLLSSWKLGTVEALLYEEAKINFCRSLPHVFSDLAKFYLRNKLVKRATMHSGTAVAQWLRYCATNR